MEQTECIEKWWEKKLGKNKSKKKVEANKKQKNGTNKWLYHMKSVTSLAFFLVALKFDGALLA